MITTIHKCNIEYYIQYMLQSYNKSIVIMYKILTLCGLANIYWHPFGFSGHKNSFSHGVFFAFTSTFVIKLSR